MSRNPCHRQTLSFLFSLFLTILCIPLFVQAEPESLTELQARSANGDKESQNLLGVKYFTGDGVTKNELKAAELFTRAARQGLPKAQFNLGHMYHQGIGLPQDYIQACVWYKAAADRGHSEAQASYDDLKPYLDEEKQKKIAHMSSQIPANAVAAANKKPPTSPSDPSHLESWIQSVQPAAGK